MINVGVVGYGYWGPNLVRNFTEIPGSRVAAVCDLNKDRLAKVRSRYPSVRTTTRIQDIVCDPGIDAVVVATPVATHYRTAMSALKAGKHVLVEKPLAESVRSCREMIAEARRRRKILMVDHTFAYTGAVRKIKDLMDNGELGDLYYYDSVRINLGLFQHDVNVVWDLAVHDLAILDYLLDRKPIAVSACGMSHVGGEPEDVAYLTLFYGGNFIAHVHVNWLAPRKVRQTLIGGSRKMLVYDDLDPSEKVRLYDKGVEVEKNPAKIYEMQVGYRTGDMIAPKLDSTEALTSLSRHFIDCVKSGKRPLTDGESGLRVVEVMEAAVKSIRLRGASVSLAGRRGHSRK